MSDDPNTPPWARRSGSGSDAPAPGGPSDAPGAAGSPGGRDRLGKPGDRPAISPGPGPQPAGGPGGGGSGRGPLIAVGAVVAVLLLAVLGVLGAVLLGGGEDRTVTVQASTPTASTVTGTPVQPPGAGGTTTSSTTTGPRAEAPSGGTTARSIDGAFTAAVPGGWDYQATSTSSGSETLRLTAPIDSGSFDESYVAVSINVRQAYSASASEQAESSRDSARRLSKEVTSLPSVSLLGQPAEAWKEIRETPSGENEARTWLVITDGKSYEISTYGSPAAHARAQDALEDIVVGVRTS